MPTASPPSRRHLLAMVVIALACVAAEGVSIARPTITITNGRGGYSGIGIPAPSQIHPFYHEHQWGWPGVTRYHHVGFGSTYFQTHYRRYGQFYYAYPPYWWVRYGDRYYTSRATRRSRTYQRPPLVGLPVWRDPAEMEAEREAQAAQRAAAVEPPPPIDEALVALRARDYATAAAQYRSRDEQRLEALALVGANELKRAVEAFVEAYKGDADLPKQPMNALGLIGARSELRSIVNRAVRYAHSEKTAEAWFTVAVLMQGEGRDDTANKMMARARKAEAEGRGRVPKADPKPIAPPAPPAPAAPAPPSPPEAPAPPDTLRPPEAQHDADMGQAPKPGGVVR